MGVGTEDEALHMIERIYGQVVSECALRSRLQGPDLDLGNQYKVQHNCFLLGK